MTRVLGLDLSRNTGWAVDGLAGDDMRPEFGTWRLPPLDPDNAERSFEALYDHVLRTCRDFRVELGIYESPLSMGAHTGRAPKNSDIAMALLQLAGIAGLAFRKAGVDAWQGHIQTVRRYFVGHGRPQAPKATVMHRCRLLGWRVQDDNSADALAIWAFAKIKTGARFTTAGPLIGGAAA